MTIGSQIPHSRAEVLDTKEIERIAKLRTLKDRATYFLRQRQQLLKQLKEKCEFREKDDENNMVISIQGVSS